MTATDTDTDAPLEVGDVVTIASGSFPLTWTIVAIHSDPDTAGANGPMARLESGQTGRHRYEPLVNLTRFIPTPKEN